VKRVTTVSDKLRQTTASFVVWVPRDSQEVVFVIIITIVVLLHSSSYSVWFVVHLSKTSTSAWRTDRTQRHGRNRSTAPSPFSSCTSSLSSPWLRPTRSSSAQSPGKHTIYNPVRLSSLMNARLFNDEFIFKIICLSSNFVIYTCIGLYLHITTDNWLHTCTYVRNLYIQKHVRTCIFTHW